MVSPQGEERQRANRTEYFSPRHPLSQPRLRSQRAYLSSDPKTQALRGATLRHLLHAGKAGLRCTPLPGWPASPPAAWRLLLPQPETHIHPARGEPCG